MEQGRDWFHTLAIAYPVALFIAGLILMLWPRKKKNSGK
jgi:cbb3-type cytochrome oxidase subunit 3